MAQYYTDFSEPNAVNEWTSRWVSGASISVQSEGAENYLQIITPETNGRRFISWDAVPDAAQVNVLMRSSGDFDRRIITRGSGSSGGESGWAIGRNAATGATITRYRDGGINQFASETNVSVSADDVTLSEANSNGNDHEYREWPVGGSAPDWLLSASSIFVVEAGRTGVFIFPANATRKIWTFAVGTDGDPAPTGPLSTTEAFALRHNPRTNKVIPVLSSPTVTDIGANCVRPRVSKGY